MEELIYRSAVRSTSFAEEGREKEGPIPVSGSGEGGKVNTLPKRRLQGGKKRSTVAVCQPEG